MKRPFIALLALAAPFLAGAAPSPGDLARWQQHADHVTIIRDHFGIPHVYGQTDADAAFGLLFAQAEDDFPRIELNYLNALGRLAEVEGERAIYSDLRMKLYIDPVALKELYGQSPAPLRALMDGFADGLNYFLHTHPAVKPRLLTQFEPWMALAFSEGSIGGDIESGISLRALEQFYGPRTGGPLTALPPEPPPGELQGSNGFAIAPKNTVRGHALLLINPHTTFYFRPEVHVVSDEGLNAYGAVTWGQFFVYQGFNERLGWMHTSAGGDVIDEYLETVREKPGAPGTFFYDYGDEERPLTAKTIVVPYRDGAARREKKFTAYFSHHGPIVRSLGAKWVAVKLMQDPLRALTQSYGRTKARTYAEFLQVMELRTNTSNNTVYADADGNIAYFHGNFIPRRDPQFDWTQPVDGSNPATEWQGRHEIKETITLLNPRSGWLANSNNWPFTAAGPSSPRREDYPAYMWSAPENERGRNYVRVLSGRTDFTLDSLIATAYDPYLIAFDKLLPPLFAAFDALPAGDPQRAALAGALHALRGWNRRTTLKSVPTSVAVIWAQELVRALSGVTRARDVPLIDHVVAASTGAQKLAALQAAITRLTRDFGKWQTPWGEINRFQRLSGAIDAGFDDTKPSLPVAFTSADWGSLAAFSVTGPPQHTKKIYGNRGNSFVAVVEFGPQLRAKSILAGGESGDPASPHFADQAERYTKAKFKNVLFYRRDVEKNAERMYHPGG